MSTCSPTSRTLSWQGVRGIELDHTGEMMLLYQRITKFFLYKKKTCVVLIRTWPTCMFVFLRVCLSQYVTGAHAGRAAAKAWRFTPAPVKQKIFTKLKVPASAVKYLSEVRHTGWLAQGGGIVC